MSHMTEHQSGGDETGALKKDLARLAALHRKYQNYGQMLVLEEIIATFDTPQPDFNRLAGTEMWGGAGAVWESPLEESPTDKKSFRETVIQIALSIERLGLGTDRSRFIAGTLQSWLAKGI
jgi:hypothetical protein